MDDPVQIFADVEQGSERWLELRRGIPTSSMFKVLMVKNEAQKGRLTYLRKLAGERLTGESMENFSSSAMEDGKTKEPILRDHYSFVRDVEVQQVGFIRNGKSGCSPDGLIGDDGMLEIKRAAPHVLIPMLEAAKSDPAYFPMDHYPQCQGGLMVSDRKWCDLVVGYPKMPRPLIIRCERDEGYISELRNEVDRFDLDLRRLVERLR